MAIPIDAETARRRPAGIRLSEMEAGSPATIYRITEEAEEDAGLLSYLEARALTPGAQVTILARSESLDSLTLDGPRGTRHAWAPTRGARPGPAWRGRPGALPPGAGTGDRWRSRMIEFVRSRHVDASPERIWPFVEDVAAWPRWFTEAERGEILSGAGIGRPPAHTWARSRQGDRDRFGGDGLRTAATACAGTTRRSASTASPARWCLLAARRPRSRSSQTARAPS